MVKEMYPLDESGPTAEQKPPARPTSSVTTAIPKPRNTSAHTPYRPSAPPPFPGNAGPPAPSATPKADATPPVPPPSSPRGENQGPIPRPPPPAVSRPQPAPDAWAEAGTTSAPARRSSVPTQGERRVAPRFFPTLPRNLSETGLTQSMVEELILKALFFAGEMRGGDIANKICLPTSIVDDVIEGLRKSKYVDLKGGGGLGVGKSAMVFTLTTYATELLKQILDRNRYNGPAPVLVEDWMEAVRAQSLRGSRIQRAKMEDKFENLIVKDYIFDGLGPAMNSGRAIFFYGAPGNGKTAICQSLIRCYDGDIYVPHALLVDDFIIRVYDPTLHIRHDEDRGVEQYDQRWVRCSRPLVVVGGELTLETLDLIYSSDVKYYEAPFQLKATNGMLLIDDFGRQKVSPKDLLNRWIVPLENDVDYLTLHTGKKMQVPFDVFTAFSTNLDPGDLVDDAFLRRVRYKLEVQPPDEQQFHQIWEVVCQKRGVAYDHESINWLIDTHYRPTRRPFAACQPRDLLEQVVDISHYRGMHPHLSPELLDAAVKNYFVKFKKG